MNRFRLTLQELPDALQNHIHCIELWTNLKFNRAEDWRVRNEGWVIHFDGEVYKFDSQTWDDIIYRLKLEFQHNPSIKTLEEGDTTQFEGLEFTGNDYSMYLAQW